MVYGLWAWLESQRGRTEEALEKERETGRLLANISDSRSTQIGGMGLLGRSSLAGGRWSEAEKYWRRFLELKPDPVDEPTAWYGIGSALLGSGDAQSAKDAFHHAISTGLETHHVHLASQQLDKLREQTA